MPQWITELPSPPKCPKNWPISPKQRVEAVYPEKKPQKYGVFCTLWVDHHNKGASSSLPGLPMCDVSLSFSESARTESSGTLLLQGALKSGLLSKALGRIQTKNQPLSSKNQLLSSGSCECAELPEHEGGSTSWIFRGVWVFGCGYCHPGVDRMRLLEKPSILSI